MLIVNPINSTLFIPASTRVSFDPHLERTNSYNTIMMNNTLLPIPEQRILSEQAQVEEKRSLSALNLFVSK